MLRNLLLTKQPHQMMTTSKRECKGILNCQSVKALLHSNATTSFAKQQEPTTYFRT